ncbi:MAG: SH3 domain-containing protein [Clostridium sp.]|nr:SH3 domain-containing protein [Clostridium sp.]
MRLRSVIRGGSLLGAIVLCASIKTTVSASNLSSLLPGGGVSISISNQTTMTTSGSTTQATLEKLESLLDETLVAQARHEATLAALEAENDRLRDLVIAQVHDYVNVRSLPNEKSEIVGKLYNNSVGVFISESNGWYQINSGTVT